jgi:H+-transporting ATPase
MAATPNAPDTVFSNRGPTSDAARRQLAQFDPNAIPDTGVHPLAMALDKLWAPVPWMLEAAIVLELVLAALGLLQESRAQATLLPTRLSAVDEAASMVVLCADKTGTLTQNALRVTTVRPMPGFDEPHVLALAALASSDGGEDPVDRAIRAAAASKAVSDAPKLIKFAAFDPAKKMSEATATDAGNPQRIVKGA